MKSAIKDFSPFSFRLYQCLVLLTFVGCIAQPKAPPQTQLQIREFQTREYTGKSMKPVMKAVIGALQDDGFIIRNADKELGFISASKEVDVSDSNQVFWSQLLGGENARYQKSSLMEASANISEFGKEIKVRVVFQVKISDNFGSPIETKTVTEPVFYRDFFSKVDKSIFFEAQGL